MAKLGNLYIKLDPFITDTRMRACLDMSCRFNNTKRGDLTCGLKQIEIDQEGKCGKRQPTEDT